MPGDQNKQALTPFGRIPLARIAGEWSESRPHNPRLIAEWVSEAIVTLAPPDQQIQALHVAAWANGKRLCEVSFTYRELADYFAAISVGSSAPIFSNGQTHSAANVLVWREWIDRIVTEAVSRADMAAYMVIPASQDAVSIAATASCLTATLSRSRHPMPSGSEPGFLSTRQALLRQQGEKSAAARLDEKDAELLQLSEALAAAQARIAALEILREQDREDAEEAMREARDARRATQRAEQFIAEHAGVLAFMDECNPLSPCEGRNLITIWADMTKGGTVDPVAEGGIGLREVITRFATRNGQTLSDTMIKRLTWALAWPARKNGGAVSRPSKEKG